ncbi:MAG: type I-E CRISPR-associated protein Cas6/Cse3/CasE, partial [Verrucomicrobia bacterium]|nr:type I-E CRISPR-associated protein Cas6/Cse3/CasE [Verrucomicrobiota bacterium]
MNYLARLFLDYPTSALQSIDDAYDWHQRAWETLAHSAQGDQRGDGQFRPFLTRLDPQEGGYQLLILSRTEPRRPSWCPDHPANWQTKMVAESLLEHRRYRFDLRANPTRKVTP